MTEHHDELLGTLVQDPQYGEWSTDVGGVYFILESLEALPHAHKIITDLATWTAQAKSYAAKEMLGRKNTTYPDKDADGNTLTLTAENFKERMTLQTIFVQPDGAFSFDFDDGDLFVGHLIYLEHDGETWSQASIQG